MKKLSFLFLFSFVFSLLSAQDVIELVSGERIEATVLEVGLDIRYLRYDFLDGPVYAVERSQVLVITYKGGREEIINREAAAQSNSFALRESYLKVQGRNYYEGFRQIDRAEFEQKLQTDAANFDRYQRGRNMVNGGYVVTGTGVLIMLVGAVASRPKKHDVYLTPTPSEEVGFPRLGGIFGGMGLSLVGVCVTAVGTQKVNQAIDHYNIQVGKTGRLAPAIGTDGIGLVLRF